MDWIVIDGVRPWDGRYELDLSGSPPTSREWGWIKRLSGYLPANVEEGFSGADPELFCAFAAIALRRADRIDARQVPEIFERLADAPFGSTIRFDSDTADQEGADADGPPDGSSTGNEPSSGEGSRTSSETSPLPTPVPSGIPGSDGSESPRIWSVS